MKIKTSELTGHALRWAAAKADGALAPLGNLHLVGKDLFIGVGGDLGEMGQWVRYAPDEDGTQGMAIIEREKISLRDRSPFHDDWEAERRAVHINAFGPTPLIAAVRCFVASTLGDEVDVPEELT